MRLLGAAGLLVMAAIWCTPHAALAAKPKCQPALLDNERACSVDPTLDRTALCNDGSVPAFWYRPGAGSGANTWLIWLGGGGACDSQSSCAVEVAEKGSNFIISSKGFEPTPGNGIMSDNPNTNPMLYNANMVYLHYCSSDSWAGDTVGTGKFNVNNSDTWHFEGRRIAITQIKSIGELLPAIENAAEIILGGDSSGGIGVTEVANDLLPLLPAAATKLLVNDAGFSLDIGQYDVSAGAPYVYPDHPNSFETNVSQRLAYWNGRGDAVCDAAATTPRQHVNCYNSSYILQYGFIAVPSFVAQSQLDPAQITQELCPLQFGVCPVSHDPATPPGIYATQFGVEMAAAVVGAGTPAAYTAYSPDVYTHVILNKDPEFNTPHQFPQGLLTPSEVFDAWLANPTATRVTYIGNAPGVQ
jgi:hypothetical protein